MKFLSYKKITIGELDANQFIIIEIKSLFSIIFYFFKGSGWQDRFHTHAFNAVSFRIFGSYRVRDIIDGKVVESARTSRVKFFSKKTNHMLGPSQGCLTLLIAGPWDKTWIETKDGQERVLTWGRKRISQDNARHEA